MLSDAEQGTISSASSAPIISRLTISTGKLRSAGRMHTALDDRRFRPRTGAYRPDERARASISASSRRSPKMRPTIGRRTAPISSPSDLPKAKLRRTSGQCSGSFAATEADPRRNSIECFHCPTGIDSDAASSTTIHNSRRLEGPRAAHRRAESTAAKAQHALGRHRPRRPTPEFRVSRLHLLDGCVSSTYGRQAGRLEAGIGRRPGTAISPCIASRISRRNVRASSSTIAFHVRRAADRARGIALTPCWSTPSRSMARLRPREHGSTAAGPRLSGPDRDR